MEQEVKLESGGGVPPNLNFLYFCIIVFLYLCIFVCVVVLLSAELMFDKRLGSLMIYVRWVAAPVHNYPQTPPTHRK